MASVEEKTMLTKQIKQLTMETDSLEKEVKRLREVINRFENVVDNSTNIRVIDVKDIPFEEVKKKIHEYYKTHEKESVYPDEVADELDLDLKVTMRAVEELLKENKLEAVE